ncbi:MAG: serine O-acetyltransferase [Planctomycetota bacterium]|nr:serine O-acetyltransferase [Planctomycetota bacterium]MDA1106433.1 serine O-acetyltransferase [Planctomycetota bacterium]
MSRPPRSSLPSVRAVARVVDALPAALFPEHHGAGATPLACSKAFGVAFRTACEPVVPARARRDHWTSLHASLPSIRMALDEDARAAVHGDPAATGLDEVILCYPGLFALSVHRVAHAIHALGVLLIPRMMAEVAHSRTGVDIHPAADIAPGCFIDHGTGVVIGESAVIGPRCTLYQGVTLGALRFEHDADGRVVRGSRRHPTLEADVTVYANATILGGSTVVGAGSVIGADVFLTASVPAGSKILGTTPTTRLR